MDTCLGVTTTGDRCKRRPGGGQTRCHMHREDGAQCSVCLQALTRATRVLPCGHEFHLKCVDRWKRACRGDPTCPMCRVPFDLPKYRVRIVVDRVAEMTYDVRSYTTSNIQAIREEFGLDLRILEAHEEASLNILFELGDHENIDEVFTSLGVPGLHSQQETQ